MNTNAIIAGAVLLATIVAFVLVRGRRRPHAHARELDGLVSCLVAYRRSVLENSYRENPAEHSSITEKLSKLALYTRAAGITGQLARDVVLTPIGGLDESTFLESHWRIETAAGIAWALCLIETIPERDERANANALTDLFPLDGPPSEAIRLARLRDTSELEEKLIFWKRQTADSRKEREEEPRNETVAFRFSRVFERARALSWILSRADQIEDVTVEA